MPKKSPQKRDGCYQRTDRAGWWIIWTDAQGRRRCRKTDAANITQAEANPRGGNAARRTSQDAWPRAAGQGYIRGSAARYLKHQKVRLTPSTYAREEGILRVHLARFNPLKLSAIRKLDIQRYVTERAVEVSAGSVRRELAALKHIFSLAVEWELIPVSPAQRVKAAEDAAGPRALLQPTELRALLEACPDGLREIVALAVSTGMRRGEVMGLRYLDVDLSNRRILLPQTKNGDSRIVYLNAMAMMVLKSVEAGAPGDRVFSDWQPDQVTMAFAGYAEGFRFLTSGFTTCATRRQAGCAWRARTFTRSRNCSVTKT